MRYEIKEVFQPITISITIENEEELQEFTNAIGNTTGDWSTDLYKYLDNKILSISIRS
jgi:hypothetical protein